MKRFYYDEKQFYLDGKVFPLRSGAIHYFRVPKPYWRDRLLKLKECGLTCVETYVPWNLHEPKRGDFYFSGDLDLAGFIEVAASLGLYVIVRPGPYICAEWEAGGLPYWLQKEKNLRIRTHQPAYLERLTPYLQKVIDILRPYHVERGGNVLMLQLENEYGSFGSDPEYLAYLKEFYAKNFSECILFTADGEWREALENGTTDSVLACVNFGSQVAEKMEYLKEFRPRQPYCCMEFWCGWFDHWGEKHHTRPWAEKEECFKAFLQNGYGFNIYMFHGGTNFGFMNGANLDSDGNYQPTVTSYDYDGILTECGDRTKSYYALRELLKEYNGAAPALTATETEKRSYGKVTLVGYVSFLDAIQQIGRTYEGERPLTFSEMDQAYGYAYYETQGTGEEFSLKIHDRATVFLENRRETTFYRKGETMLTLSSTDKKIGLLVENCGRVNYGKDMFDDKGIVGMAGTIPKSWKTIALPMDNIQKLAFSSWVDGKKEAGFCKGIFTVDKPCDTFLELSGFEKGIVFVNGIHVGRYWNIGPQKRLYIPAPWLRKGENELVVFDSDGMGICSVELKESPDIG